MADLAEQLPDLPALTAGLSSVMGGAVTVLNRDEHEYESTYPSEVVTCRCPDGIERKVLCKYSAQRDHQSYGHRGGIRYEAQVYRRVLAPVTLSAPRCYGTYDDPASGWTWLILEYIADG